MIYKTVNIHMARPYPKRAAGVAMANAIGGISNIWGSYLYYDEPRYTTAFATVLACAFLFLLTITAYRWHVRGLNRLLDGGREEDMERVKRSGVTQQQIELDWRYVGY